MAVAFAFAAGAFALYALREQSEAKTAARAAELEKAIAEGNAAKADTAAADEEKQRRTANENADEAIRQKNEAVKSESVALTALADSEVDKHPIRATKLALAAWPRDNDDLVARPRLQVTLQQLQRALAHLRERRI